MLIGIHGKIESGKDTLGMMLQALSMPKHSTYSENPIEYLNNYKGRPNLKGGWEIRKYGDKLKDIVCLLIGCTREQLESEQFKNKELGQEWWYFQVGSILKAYKDYLPQYEKLSDANRKEMGDTLIKMTPRRLLQTLGTEAGRNIIHPNVWVNALFADYKPLGFCEDQCQKAVEEGHVSSSCISSMHCMNAKYPDWIITDVRFVNEAKAVKEAGGILVKIERSNEKAHPKIWKGFVTQNRFPWWHDYVNHIGRTDLIHSSETGLDHFYNWDFVISNDKTLQDLLVQARRIFKTQEKTLEI